jgi:hypothetical protein
LSGQVTIYDIIESPGKAWAHVREPFFSSKKKLCRQDAHKCHQPKVQIHGEPQEGKPFDIECIYQFTFTGDSTAPKVKALIDFVDSIALAAMG